MRKFLKVLLFIVAGVVLVASLALLLISTQWFWKSQILPRVSQAAGMPVTAERISFSPFSKLELENLRVGADAGHPLVQGRLLRCRYSLLALLKGELKVNEVLVDGFKVELIQDEKGKWNFPQPPPAAGKAKASADAGGASAPPAWPNLNNIEIRDFALVLSQAAADGKSRNVELKNFNLKLPVVRRGERVQVEWQGDLRVEQGKEIQLTGAQVAGTMTADLDSRFQPKTIKLQAGISHFTGKIKDISLAGHEAQAEMAVENAGAEWRITQCRFAEKVNGTPEAVANLTGVVNPERKTAQVNELLANVALDGRNVVDLKLSAPVSVAWGGTAGAPVNAAPAKVELKLDRLPLALANLFLEPASGARVDAGNLNAAIVVEIADLGQSLHVTGTSSIDDFAGQAANQVFRQVGVRKSFDLNLRGFRKLEIVRQESEVTLAGATALQLIVKGEVDLQDLTGHFTGQMPVCNEKLLAVLPGATKAAAAIKRMQVTAEWKAGLEAKGKRISVTATVNVPELAAINPVDGKPLPVLVADASLAAEADLDASKLTVGKLDSSLAADGQKFLEMQLTQPVEIKWKGATASSATAVAPATLQIQLKQFNLQMLNPFLPPSAKTQIQAGTLSAAITAVIANMGQELSLNGMIEGAGITATVGADAVRNIGFKNRFNLTCTDLKQIKISGTELELLAAAEPVFTAAVDGQLDDLKTLTGEFKVRLPLCNRKVLDLVPGAAKAAGLINRLEAQGEMTVKLAEKGQMVTAAGTLSTPVLELSLPDGKPMPAMKTALEFEIKTDLNKKLLTVNKLTVGVEESSRPLVNVRLTRAATVAWGEQKAGGEAVSPAELKIKVDKLNLPLLNPFLAAKGISITGGTLDVDLGVVASRMGNDLQISGALKVNDLDLTTPQAAFSKIAVQENLDLSLRDFSHVDIRRLDIDTAQDGKHLADLTVNGNFELPPAKAAEAAGKIEKPPAQTESVLNVSSKEIAGQVIGAMLAGGGEKNPAPVPSAPAAIPGTASEPPPVDLGGLWLTLNLNLAKITYGEVLVSDVKSKIRIKDNKVDVDPLDLGLNGTPVHFTAAADLNQPGYQYKVDGKFAGLNLAPFIATFAPAMKDQFSGTVKQFELSVAGAGITPRNLQKNFNGKVILKGEKIGIQNMPALDAVADKYGLTELKQIRFDAADFLLQSENGRMAVKEGTVAGPDLQLKLSGGIYFDQRLDLKAVPGVGGALEARLKRIPNLVGLLGEKQGNYTMLYLEVPISGTLSRPQMPPIKDLITQATAKVVINTGTKVLNEAIKTAAEGGKVNLGDILKNAVKSPAETAIPGTSATTAAPAAAPAANNGVGNLLNMLGGGTQAAPAAGTAAAPATTGKKKNSDAWKELGTGLLNNLRQGK